MPRDFAELSALQALAAMASDTAPTLLDVRVPEDQDGTRLLGAVPVDYTDVAAQIALCPHGAIVVCHKGLKISAGVTARLRARGVAAQRLTGGHVGWVAQGLPTTTEATPPCLAVTLDATPAEALAAWAMARFVAPHADLLDVPRADLAGVLSRFEAVPPGPLPDLPGLSAVAKTSDFAELALHDARASALFPSFDLAFRGALRHETVTPVRHVAGQEARP